MIKVDYTHTYTVTFKPTAASATFKLGEPQSVAG